MSHALRALAPDFELSLLGIDRVGELPVAAPCVVEPSTLSDDEWGRLCVARGGCHRIVVIGGNELRPRLADLLEKQGLRHLHGRGPEQAIDGRDLGVTLRKLIGEGLGGVAPYLSTPHHSLEFEILRSSDKRDVVGQAARFANSAGVGKRFADAFSTVVDEFVTNAVYNAPTDATGTPRFAHLGRGVEVALEPHEAVRVQMAFDGGRLALAVTDRFGVLTAERVQRSMARALRKEKNQVNFREGGAGIGIFYAFELLSHLVVNVTHKVSTEVVGLIDTQPLYREWAGRSKSFNVFVRGAD